jgi:hypothetical protein
MHSSVDFYFSSGYLPIFLKGTSAIFSRHCINKMFIRCIDIFEIYKKKLNIYIFLLLCVLCVQHTYLTIFKDVKIRSKPPPPPTPPTGDNTPLFYSILECCGRGDLKYRKKTRYIHSCQHQLATAAVANSRQLTFFPSCNSVKMYYVLSIK